VFIFRTSEGDKPFIWSELQQGRLRQGWGCEGSSLGSQQRPIAEDHWIQAMVVAAKERFGFDWTEAQARKRYRIHRNMLRMSPGDLVLVPRVPTPGEFSLVRVTETYRFELPKGYHDFGHIIAVDPSSVESIGHHSSYTARTIVRKLRGYQSAVNNVYDREFIGAVTSLLEGSPSTPKPSTTVKDAPELLAEIREPLLRNYLDGLKKMTPRDVEQIVSKVFEGAGYELVRGNQYDREGGDADLVMLHKLPLIGDLTQSKLSVFVQVKSKWGRDESDWKGVLQLAQIAADNLQSLKILVSTVDEFSPRCVETAEQENVILVNGPQLADLLVRYI
jgi:hypothetical protein